jgi:hypothetical protein
MKVLKASGRAPELEAWKQLFSSLEDRIRTHQQVKPYIIIIVVDSALLGILFCIVAEVCLPFVNN